MFKVINNLKHLGAGGEGGDKGGVYIKKTGDFHK